MAPTQMKTVPSGRSDFCMNGAPAVQGMTCVGTPAPAMVGALERDTETIAKDAVVPAVEVPVVVPVLLAMLVPVVVPVVPVERPVVVEVTLVLPVALVADVPVDFAVDSAVVPVTLSRPGRLVAV